MSTPHLSFLLAGSLPLDLDFKQSLLSTLSEAKRLQAVVDYLEAILPGLRRRRKRGGISRAANYCDSWPMVPAIFLLL